MKKVKKTPISEIEAKAEKGKDVNNYFSKGKMMEPLDVQRVNVDFTIHMLTELDQLSTELNVSRQAVIKMLIMHALDEHKLAKKAPDQKPSKYGR